MALEDILNVRRKPKKQQSADSMLNIPLAKRIGLKLLQKSKVKSDKISSLPLKTSVPAISESNEIDNGNQDRGESEQQLVLPKIQSACELNVCEETKSKSVTVVTEKLLDLSPGVEPHTELSDIEASVSAAGSTVNSVIDAVTAKSVCPLENNEVTPVLPPKKINQKKTGSRSSRRRSMNILPPPLSSEIVASLSPQDSPTDSMEPPPECAFTDSAITETGTSEFVSLTVVTSKSVTSSPEKVLPILSPHVAKDSQITIGNVPENLSYPMTSPTTNSAATKSPETLIFKSEIVTQKSDEVVTPKLPVSETNDGASVVLFNIDPKITQELVQKCATESESDQLNADDVVIEAEAKVCLMEDIPVDTDIKDFLEGAEESEPPPKREVVVKKSRGRRKSADFLSVMEASAFVDSPDSIKADLPMKYTRGARKQRRMSLELFRASKEAEKRSERSKAKMRESEMEMQNLQSLQEENEDSLDKRDERDNDGEKTSDNDVKTLAINITADPGGSVSLTELKPRPTHKNRRKSKVKALPLIDESRDLSVVSAISEKSTKMSDLDSVPSSAGILDVLACLDTMSSGDHSGAFDRCSTQNDVTPSNSLIDESDHMDVTPGDSDVDSPLLIEQSPSPSAEESPRRSGRKRRVVQPPKRNRGATKSRKRKAPEENVEDVYRNKLWRDQLPKEKTWETIFEEPKRKKTGEINLLSAYRKKCLIKFDEYYNLNNNMRIQQRRKKALRMGWKPIKKKKSVGPNGEDEIDVLLQERISQWESESTLLENESASKMLDSCNDKSS